MRHLGQAEAILGALEAQRAERQPDVADAFGFTEGVIGFLKCGARFGERFHERASHPDFLRALSGKDERNHLRSLTNPLLDSRNEITRRHPICHGHRVSHGAG